MLISSTLLLAGCNNATIDEERTIILEINSEVTPSFTTNFGTGSYDPDTKVYTHTISSIKDLYITLSYDDLKPTTVYIPTSQMQDKIIKKEVEFGQELDVQVNVVVNRVKSLEGLTISSPLHYSDLKISEKNHFSFILPSREDNCELKFTLPGYKEFKIN